jgi:hypothetical protein
MTKLLQKSRRWVALAVMLTMLLGLSLPVYGALVDVTDSINPILTVEMTRQDPAVIGEEFTIVYTIRNISNKPAFNLTFDATLEGLSDFSEGPFTFTPPETITMLDEGGTATLAVKFSVDADTATEKTYRLIGHINCQNATMQPCGTYTAMSSVSTSFTSAKPTLSVQDIILLDQAPDVQNGFGIRIMVKNSSLIYDLRNVQFKLDGGENFEVMDISNKKEIVKIYTNDTVGIDFKLRELEGRSSNSIKLSTGYSYANGNVALADNTEELFLPLPTESTAGNGAIPRVIIKKYTLSKDQVLAGDRIDLTLAIENTNLKPVRNILISFGVQDIQTDTGTSSATVFSPVNSSNTFHLDEIAGKTTVSKTITLYVDPGAAAKTYIVPVVIKYEDDKGSKTDLTVSDNVNIPVTQQAKLQVMTLNIPTEGFAGQPVPVTAEFANAGKVDLTEFTVSLEGNFEAQDASMYLAKLAIGATNSYAGMIIPQEEGTIEGKLIFSYTDNNNQTVTDEHPFTMNVMAMTEPDMGGGGMAGPDGEILGPDGKPIGGSIGLLDRAKQHWLPIVLGLAILGEAGYILRIKRKAKEEFFDE